MNYFRVDGTIKNDAELNKSAKGTVWLDFILVNRHRERDSELKFTLFGLNAEGWVDKLREGETVTVDGYFANKTYDGRAYAAHVVEHIHSGLIDEPEVITPDDEEGFENEAVEDAFYVGGVVLPRLTAGFNKREGDRYEGKRVIIH